MLSIGGEGVTYTETYEPLLKQSLFSFSLWVVKHVFVMWLPVLGDEFQQSSTDANKATATRRCFSWVRDVNLRVCFLIVSIVKLYGHICCDTCTR